MEENRVTIGSLAQALELQQLSGDEESLGRWIITPDVNRAGLELAGYVREAEIKRVIILGNKELSYVATLDEATQRQRFERITDGFTPCIIISSARDCPHTLREVAENKNFPMFSSQKTSSNLVVDVVGFLEAGLAPTQQVHGCLVTIYGRGILIVGDSGIGKSEATLELLRKGHILVADDAVIVSRIQNRLLGRAPEVLYGMLEIRGIGIIDCVKMFGAASVMPDNYIDFVIHLIPWNHQEVVDRAYLDVEEYYPILGLEAAKIKLPVKEGRSMSTIIESAVLNFNLKDSGYDCNKEFDKKILDYISKRSD